MPPANQLGLRKQHTKDYLNAMVDSLQNTPATKLTNGKKLRDAVDMNNLLESVDDLKDSDTASSSRASGQLEI